MYIFDLDGTLALNAHRQHLIATKPRKWDEWNAACGDDLPNKPLVFIMSLLHHAGETCIIMTGRDESQREATRTWMRQHGVPNVHMLMRSTGDYTEDTRMKMMWLKGIGGPVMIDAVFEDRKRMVDMWRGLGVQCWQVAPGEF